MTILPIKTKRITASSTSIFDLLDQYLPSLKEGSIVVVTSKIVSLCEGSVVPIDSTNKADLIAQAAQYYLPAESSPYGITLTITNNTLIPSAGIDESNGGGAYYILWPKDTQQSANQIRAHLKEKFRLNDIGILITDSKTTPLRRGTTGITIGYSGPKPLRDYIGQPDLFGKPLRVTKANLIDGLAAAAVLAMGEGSESTPIVVIDDVPFIAFSDDDPDQKELDELMIPLTDDLYGPVLQAVDWRKGGQP